jgi:hypothetical protein
VVDWLTDINIIKTWIIPRPYSKGQWRKVESIELHGFGDASEKAYGACVYMVVKRMDGSLSSMLIVSKVKVAPVKGLRYLGWSSWQQFWLLKSWNLCVFLWASVLTVVLDGLIQLLF